MLKITSKVSKLELSVLLTQEWYFRDDGTCKIHSIDRTPIIDQSQFIILRVFQSEKLVIQTEYPKNRTTHSGNSKIPLSNYGER